MSKTIDLYPSRNGQPSRMMARRDPVVYGSGLMDCPLSEQMINHYREHGFLLLHDLFTPGEIKRFQRELARLRSDTGVRRSPEAVSEPDSRELRSVFRVHQNSEVFRRLSEDERLAGIARYLLGDDVYIHQSRVNYKPGFSGREFFWHSDFETWHVEDGMPRMRALSISVSLTENFSYNGPLLLIPRSHWKYVICAGETPENHHLDSLRKQEYGTPSQECLGSLMAENGIFSAVGKPGSVLIFDCNVMHGSHGNITPYPRSNVFVVYNAMSNRVVEPFCGQAPRPEHICTRQRITAVPRQTRVQAGHG